MSIITGDTGSKWHARVMKISVHDEGNITANESIWIQCEFFPLQGVVKTEAIPLS